MQNINFIRNISEEGDSRIVESQSFVLSASFYSLYVWKFRLPYSWSTTKVVVDVDRNWYDSYDTIKD